MSVDPDAVGQPPREADEYLKEANADDPRDDPRAPAHEPATADPADAGRRSDAPEQPND